MYWVCESHLTVPKLKLFIILDFLLTTFATYPCAHSRSLMLPHNRKLP